jgi:alpha-L-rhamnosidase
MLLGDLLIWMYENVAGISSDTNEVAFKRIIMKPSFEISLDYVIATYESPYGKIVSNWKKENAQLKWDISIPPNTVAVVYLPAKSINEVKEGNRQVAESQNVQFLKMENGKAVFQIGSGNYSFTVDNLLLGKN